MPIQFESLNDRVIIKVETVEEKSPGGIIIPGNVDQRPDKGVVLSAGPDVKGLKVGDNVIFGKYSGTPIEADGEKLVSMTEAEVFCKYVST